MSTKPNYSNAVKQAEIVLMENFIIIPPVNPVDIANSYGIEVFAVEFDNPAVAGYMDFEKQAIFISKADPKNRQTFTIAHELGHWFLHKGTFAEGDKSILYRKPVGKAETSHLEKEANTFAANLLVPNSMFKEYKNLYTVTELATIFNVSSDVIGFRLMLA